MMSLMYINKLLVKREYIDFFIQIYEQWSSDNSIKCLLYFEKWHCDNSRYILKLKKRLNLLCATTVTCSFIILCLQTEYRHSHNKKYGR